MVQLKNQIITMELTKIWLNFFFVGSTCGVHLFDHLAAVSCSAVPYRLGGVGFVFWMTGKLGRAWVGAWVGAWVVHGISAWGYGVSIMM